MRRIGQVTLLVLSFEFLVGVWFVLEHRDKIYPNTTVSGIDIGSLTLPQAVQKLDAEFDKRENLKLVYDSQSWEIPVAAIGLQYDPAQTAKKAFEASHRSKLSTLLSGAKIDPIFVLDFDQTEVLIASLSGLLDSPLAKRPQVSLKYGNIVVTNGEDGVQIENQSLLNRINRALLTLNNSPIEIPTRQANLKLSETDLNALKMRAGKILDKKIVLRISSEALRFPLEKELLLSWLNLTDWEETEVNTWIRRFAKKVNRSPQDASFKFDPAKKRVEQFRPAKDGLKIKNEQLVNALLIALAQVEHKALQEIEIPIDRTAPKIQNADVNNLGIKELIGRGESRFSGSIPNRIYNVNLASSKMDGILVPPGETFSFVKYIGDISAATGYRPAYVIKEGRTVLGDGGGVCQVSSTMFRAALSSGLPIVERWAHAYRVHYYEEESQLGLDATIFAPSVDLKFKNDTPGHILIQTEIDVPNVRLVFNMYGTKDGRKAVISDSKVWGVAPPPPTLYQDDPTLPLGRLVQVDWSAWGARASFDYKVTRGSEVLQNQTFYSAYRPWRAIYLRGTRAN